MYCMYPNFDWRNRRWRKLASLAVAARLQVTVALNPEMQNPAAEQGFRDQSLVKVSNPQTAWRSIGNHKIEYPPRGGAVVESPFQFQNGTAETR